MSALIIPTEPTKLYVHYTGQSEPQPCYIELDLRGGTLLADYDAAVGGARPFSVHYGFERRYPIPRLHGEAADAWMEKIRPLADRILADWESEWNGHDTVAVLGEDGLAAEGEILAMLGLDGPPGNSSFSPTEMITVWTPDDGAVTGQEAQNFEITADTTDERLAEIEEEIRQGLAEISESPVVILDGVGEYLAGIRQDARDRIGAMSAAEFRAARDELGLTGGWLASHTGVTERTARRWEAGEVPVPYAVAERMHELLMEAHEAVERKAAQAAEAHAYNLVVWRSDEQLPQELRDTGYPARWHTRIAERVVEKPGFAIRGVRLFYSDEPGAPGK